MDNNEVVTEEVAAVVENNTGIEKQIVAKETRLCFLSSFIDKGKNELYNRPSYHYGDRLDCRRNGQGQKRDIGCLTCESCCDKKDSCCQRGNAKSCNAYACKNCK